VTPKAQEEELFEIFSNDFELLGVERRSEGMP